MTKCLHCQLELTEKYQKKFCNRSCSASYNNQFKTKNGKYVRMSKKCTVCETITYTQNTSVCSEACRKEKLSRLRKFKTKDEQYHARKMMQRESYARYAARKKYQTSVDEDLSAIKEFYRNCPDGYEVDHITPISKNGAHSISNLQYLTISENRKKSNKIMEPPERFELS